ncbi:MAG: hypothetical protein C4523_11920 [Myxococcales bacterium]|nr:MAG: hypothetical protein C4523_11920 [Myxococcales bacterium]
MFVIPAKAGIQSGINKFWTPAFAGVTTFRSTGIVLNPASSSEICIKWDLWNALADSTGR